MENNNFEESINILSTELITAPVYYIIASKNNGTVLTRDRNKLVNRLDKDILNYASTWLFPENSKFNYKDDKKLTENEWKNIYATL